ncbi:DUF3310 domain-containing protein [Corynebacterium variabile]|uniref:DUF3310 domain-containing protein n=1 Tax=Corynebacterium variabile TaxID=1727 RepID=UPI003FCF488E
MTIAEHDAVRHPSHYTSHPSGVECIEVIRGREYRVGNAAKYCWRAGLKGGSHKASEDLKKALFYLDDLIEHPSHADSGGYGHVDGLADTMIERAVAERKLSNWMQSHKSDLTAADLALAAIFAGDLHVARRNATVALAETSVGAAA